MVTIKSDLKSLAADCQVFDALSHLRLAKRAFLTAKHDREPMRSRQTWTSAECMEIDMTQSKINAVSK